MHLSPFPTQLALSAVRFQGAFPLSSIFVNCCSYCEALFCAMKMASFDLNLNVLDGLRT